MTNKNKIMDSLLVLEFRAGNKKALGLLVKRWHKKLCKQAFWYTRDMNSAKDVVQDCWPIIISKVHTLREPMNFGSWALTMVTRKSIDNLRKNKREMKPVSRLSQEKQEAEEELSQDQSTDLIRVLRAAIQELPETNQIVLNLFYLEELSIKQISEILKIPQGTVKSRLFNAREKLKLIINQKDYER